MIDKPVRYRAVVHYEHFLRSIRLVAKKYGVSKSSLQRWIRNEPRIKRHRASKQILTEIQNCITNALASNPCMSLQQLAGLVSKQCKINRTNRTVGKWLSTMKYSRKKVYNTIETTISSDKVNEFCSSYSSLTNEDIICIDEAGFYIGDHCRYGYSKRGRRIHVSSSRTLRKSRLSLIMAISSSGIVHYKIIEGNCNKSLFIQFINEMNVSGKTLIMDNVQFHHSKQTKDAIHNKNCKALYIPPYSPRFNAIEYAFSVIKNRYRSLCSDGLNVNDVTKDDYINVLIASLTLCDSFETIFGRVNDTVNRYLEHNVFERYD